jgi:hypothetical protein
MTKSLILASVALLSLGALALPAQAKTAAVASANSILTCDTDTLSHNDESNIASQLRAKGVNVSSVDAWHGCARAFVTRADGSQAMQFYDPDTLQLLGTDASRG